MVNEYPPRPTEMCEPVINGTNVVSDVYDYYINNKLNKAIDDYWQSKYPTFAKCRIKRMRKGKGSGNALFRRNRHLNYSHPYWHIALSLITRWTRH